MKVIKPMSIILGITGVDQLKLIEEAGRTCYKSEENITEDSYEKFIDMLLERGHESVLEHSLITVKFICDRGVSHELVRHRLASFSQESTRYCNYSKGKFDGQLTFIQPLWISDETIKRIEGCDDIFKELDKGDIDFASVEWFASMMDSEQAYLHLLELWWKPEQARSVLPNSLKTEIVVSANIREWRTIFKQRTSEKAHPQMRELMRPLHATLCAKLPVVFSDIKY